MRVLIIDDHAIVRRGMISLLQENFKDVEIGEAGDSKAGLAAISNEAWELVLVDISMPGRSGLELIQDIKREKPHLPILVISTHSEKDYALRALKLGASGYVSKLSAADVLVAAVERVFSGRSQARARACPTKPFPTARCSSCDSSPQGKASRKSARTSPSASRP